MLLGFGAKPLQMPDRQLPLWHFRSTSSGRQPGPLPEDHEIEKRIAHQSIASVQSAGRFTRDEKIVHVGF